jgi:peptide/nickel transport system substrate-binding protein
MEARVPRRVMALAAVAAVLAPACWFHTGPHALLVRPPNGAVAGGKIVLGAEQYPECLNPVTACASATWLYWTVIQYVMPRAMQLTLDGSFTNSPLLTEAPSLANGGITDQPFTVRFKINRAAVWSDGSPITCDDFEFTRQAILDTKGANSREGYDQIASIDCSDPHTAVLNYKDVYVDWPDVFGGATGVILEKRAFLEEANGPKVDLSREMLDSIPFSGGPWRLATWNINETVLVPNNNYWVKNWLGRPTYLDQVTILPRTETAREISDLRSGVVDAIFPQPGATRFMDSFATVGDIAFRSGPGPAYEALWMDLSAFPFNDPKVREALFYAVDREAVMKALVQLNDPSQTQPLGCGVLALPGSFWCDQEPFAHFHYDPRMVSRILSADGWARDSSGFWAKGGRKLTFKYSIAGRDRQVTTQRMLGRAMRAAGFKVTAVGPPSPFVDCFYPLLRCGFQLDDGAEYGTADPSVTRLLHCRSITTTADLFRMGDNVFHWCNREASALMDQSDRELDPTKRRDLLNQIYQIEAEDFAPALPLYAWPNITVWRSDTIAGPVGEWNGTLYGGFFNLEQWYCARRGTCV